MTAVLHFGDCLEVMKTLPDKSVDLFVCDLPYGQLSQGFDRPGDSEDKKKKYGNMTKECCDWDVKIDLSVFWAQIKRLSKSDATPILMFCNTKFGIELINSNPSYFRYDLVWDKGHGVSFLLANKMPMKSHEMIYVFSKKGCYYERKDEVVEGKKEWLKDREGEKGIKSRQYAIANSSTPKGGEGGKRCALSVIKVPGKTARGGHPTEKPRDLYKWLLERYCPPGGTVLDPTAGSFNCIKVARELGLNAIGIEKNEAFFTKAYKEIFERDPEPPTNTVVYQVDPPENPTPKKE